MIPSHAQRVFKGVLFEVYQWEQEMFDGSKKLYERLRRKPSVTILPIMKDGIIMLCEEEQPARDSFISIPGGQVEEGEQPEHASARELLEETGYEGKLELWMTTHPYGNKIDWTVHNFIARDCRKVGDQRLDSGERIKPFFVDFDHFVEIAISDPNFRSIEITLAVLTALRTPDGLAKLKKLLS